MNAKKNLALAAVLFLGAGASAQAQRVELDQVPPAVRQGIAAVRGQGPVKEIVQHAESGRMVYEVVFEKNNAPNPRVRFAADGTRMPEPVMAGIDGEWITLPGAAETTLWRSTLKVTDLPTPVQEAVRREARGREVADVDQERWQDRTVYEVEFAEPGRNSQIHVAEDGTLVRDEPRRSLKSLFLGTQIKDTPPAVQATIQRLTEDREIVDIDRRGTRERPIYRVVARRAGIHYEVVHIAEDGTVLSGSPPADARR